MINTYPQQCMRLYLFKILNAPHSPSSRLLQEQHLCIIDYTSHFPTGTLSHFVPFMKTYCISPNPLAKNSTTMVVKMLNANPPSPDFHKLTQRVWHIPPATDLYRWILTGKAQWSRETDCK